MLPRAALDGGSAIGELRAALAGVFVPSGGRTSPRDAVSPSPLAWGAPALEHQRPGIGSQAWDSLAGPGVEKRALLRAVPGGPADRPQPPAPHPCGQCVVVFFRLACTRQRPVLGALGRGKPLRQGVGQSFGLAAASRECFHLGPRREGGQQHGTLCSEIAREPRVNGSAPAAPPDLLLSADVAGGLAHAAAEGRPVATCAQTIPHAHRAASALLLCHFSLTLVPVCR